MIQRVLMLSAVVLLSGCGYNRIQTLDEQASAAQGQIENQLQRRADLVPNLVATVRGYAQHEETVFTEVASARAGVIGAVRGGDMEQMANANAQMTGVLGRLLMVAEAYPQLKADQQFIRLQDELAGTENRIATARGDYNESVRQYNSYIRQFPQVMTAKVTGAREKKYFTVTDASAREVPQVDFSRPAPAPGQSPAPTP
jgi:LemA protein